MRMRNKDLDKTKIGSNRETMERKGKDYGNRGYDIG